MTLLLIVSVNNRYDWVPKTLGVPSLCLYGSNEDAGISRVGLHLNRKGAR
jgi:hypothetical protein